MAARRIKLISKTKTIMVRSSYKIILVYVIGVLGVIILSNTPFSLCVFLRITGLPCPGCGLTRAIILVSRLDFLGAVRMNVIALPLFVGGAVYFVCAVVEAVTYRPALHRFNSIMARKWVIAVAVILMAVSWAYNIMHR